MRTITNFSIYCLISVSVGAQPAVASPVIADVVSTTIGHIQEPTARSARAERRANRAAERRRAREARRRARVQAELQRQEQARQAPTANGGNDILVIGVRGSIASARNKKRNAKQIVDAVVAEDAGKLPDNNVPEALARIAGVNILRGGGRGNEVTIRGLAGVQTTINGRDVVGAPSVWAGSNDSGSGGAGRAMNLADVPAELVKSVEVYKTRTADQVEGGIAGTVNIELRRPLDLKKGWTLAAGVRGQYNDVSELTSPFYSALVGKRIETGMGEIGILLNGSYAQNKWNDIVIDSESPARYFPDWTGNYERLDPDIRDKLILPFKVKNIRNTGQINQKAVSGVLQWRPDEYWDFVVEGNYFGNTSRNDGSALEVRFREWPYNFSGIKFNDRGAVSAIDITNASWWTNNEIPLQNWSGGSESVTDNYQANFEAHWRNSIAQIDLGATFNRNQWTNDGVGVGIFFPGQQRIVVDFDSDAVPGGGPFITAPGLNPADASRARIFNLSQNTNSGRADSWAAQADLRLDLNDIGGGLLRAFKIGFRMTGLKNNWTYAYRGVNYDTAAPDGFNLPLNGIPGVNPIVQTPRIAGGSQFSFASINTRQLYENWDETRALILRSPFTSWWIGGGRATSLEEAWGTPVPGGERGSEGSSTENVVSMYAMLDYGFKLGIPFDGNVGIRYINTYGKTFGVDAGTRPRLDRNGQPMLDDDGLPLFDSYDNDTRSGGNSADWLPSAYITAHLTDKLQLRLAYSYNVQRPSFWDLRSSLFVNPQSTPPYADAGNPNLGPLVTNDYNASLEWFFGQFGSISLNGFIKKQSNLIFRLPAFETIPGYSQQFNVYRPRNGGNGRTEGIEAAATTNFSFIDSSLRPLGFSANLTYLPTAWFELPFLASRPNEIERFELRAVDQPWASKYTYNVIGFYDNGMLSARVAYNWRSKFKLGDLYNTAWMQTYRPISRLDAAINYTPYPWITYTIEGSNLTGASDRRYYGDFNIPVGLLQQGRLFTAGVRVRF